MIKFFAVPNSLQICKGNIFPWAALCPWCIFNDFALLKIQLNSPQWSGVKPNRIEHREVRLLPFWSTEQQNYSLYILVQGLPYLYHRHNTILVTRVFLEIRLIALEIKKSKWIISFSHQKQTPPLFLQYTIFLSRELFKDFWTLWIVIKSARLNESGDELINIKQESFLSHVIWRCIEVWFLYFDIIVLLKTTKCRVWQLTICRRWY